MANPDPYNPRVRVTSIAGISLYGPVVVAPKKTKKITSQCASAIFLLKVKPVFLRRVQRSSNIRALRMKMLSLKTMILSPRCSCKRIRNSQVFNLRGVRRSSLSDGRRVGPEVIDMAPLAVARSLRSSLAEEENIMENRWSRIVFSRWSDIWLDCRYMYCNYIRKSGG